ncbi:MAG: hypothetical protein AB7S26_12685 [Sandaracinaceae bacterium]
MSRPLVVAGLALAALTGCAENAILELSVRLPPAPDETGWFAEVQARNAATHQFNVPWMGGATVRALPLTASVQTIDCVSLDSHDGTIDVNVRVRFCHSESCGDLADSNPPERFFRIEHPFYIGRRTYLTLDIDQVPECRVNSTCGGIGVCDATTGDCRCAMDSDCPPGHACELSRCVAQVDHCAVAGCIEGAAGMFCTSSGVHFCEEGDDVDRSDDLLCDPP